MAGAKLLRQTDGARDVHAGRATHAETLVLEQVEGDGERFVIRNLEGIIDDDTLEVLGDAALSDAFGDGGTFRLQFARLVVAEEGSTHRIGEGNLHIPVALLEREADATQRTAGAHGGDEAIDLAVGLRPDFGRGGFDVGLPVRHVVELVGPDAAHGLGEAA